MPLSMPNLKFRNHNWNVYTFLGVPPSSSNSNFPEKTNRNDPENTFDPSHKFVSSPHIAPLALAALRLLIGTYTFVTLVVVLVWKAEVIGGASSFLSYFTYLTYIGLCAYYFAAGTQTLAYALSLRHSGASSMRRPTGSTSALRYPLQSWPRVLQAMHVLLQATVVTFPFIVTVVFWALLADATTLSGAFSAWSNLSVHAFNTVFALLEVLGTNAPPAPWLALLFCELCLVGYLGVAYITHATQGIYTYSFLDPAKQGPLLAAYIIGIALAECLVFALVRGLVVLRERWAVRTGRLVLSTLSSGVGVTIPAHVRDSRETEMENATALGKKEAGTIEIEEEEWEEVETPVSADLGGRVRRMQDV